MARMKIDLPEKPAFTTEIPVRITDLNYGGHVGNDKVLSLLHEARIQCLRGAGYSEMNFAGTGLIMADVAIIFKKELFYGDVVAASVWLADFSTVGFNFYYRLEKNEAGKIVLVATARSGMVCYDYKGKKISAVPPAALLQFGG